MRERLLLAFLLASPACTTPPAVRLPGGTTDMVLEMGSPVVTLDLRAKDGGARPTRFLVDTGGGAFMLTEAVARELGLEV